MRIVIAAAAAVFLSSCAPRFTVYIDLAGKISTTGITVLAVDTVDVSGYKQKCVEYVTTRDMGRLEKAFLSRRVRKMKPEVDKLTR